MKQISFDDLKPGYDIAVIGSGASGCAFLKNIDPKFNVLCIDYRKFPRFKACSGIIVTEGKEYFNDVNIPKSVFADTTVLNLKYLDLDNNLQSYSKKGFLNTWRKNLDEWLFTGISNPSIDFISECKFIDFYYTSDKSYLVVTCEYKGVVKTFVCKYLVGCDGANSAVRSKISNKHIRYYVAIQEFIDQKFNDDAYFIFDSTITDFYGWVIPKGDKVEIGCALNPYRAKEKYDVFKEKIKKRFNILNDGKIESALILRPKNFSDINLGENNVMLCGEAAALITPSAAEGISNALHSGKYCANSLNSSFGKSPIGVYKKNLSGLLARLKTKFKKADLISDKKLRVKLFSD